MLYPIQETFNIAIYLVLTIIFAVGNFVLRSGRCSVFFEAVIRNKVLSGILVSCLKYFSPWNTPLLEDLRSEFHIRKGSCTEPA